MLYFNAFSEVSLQNSEYENPLVQLQTIFLEFLYLMVRREISGLNKRVMLYDILAHVADAGNVRKRQNFKGR